MSTKLKAGTATSGAVIDADTTGILELQSGSTPTTAITVDASQNVGIGTATPYSRLRVKNNSTGFTGGLSLQRSDTLDTYEWVIGADNSLYLGYANNASGADASGDFAVRTVIDSSGNLLVGTTSSSAKVTIQGSGDTLFARNTSASGFSIVARTDFTSSNGNLVALTTSGGIVGTITTNGSSTAYNTSSDYRLKENISPMTGALDKVSALKPVTYTWKVDGSAGEGFIAHELAQVCPEAVAGTKDAVETVDDVDVEGKVIGTKEVPKYQGIDTSFLVATLTAAIQELNAKVDAQAAEIKALKGVA